MLKSGKGQSFISPRLTVDMERVRGVDEQRGIMVAEIESDGIGFTEFANVEIGVADGKEVVGGG